jgi:hypothetical protein
MNHNTQNPNAKNKKSKRVPENKNLKRYREPLFKGFPVMVSKGDLIEPYLDSTHDVVMSALEDHPRTMAIRFDLRFPSWYCTLDGTYPNHFISDFVQSLKAIIANDRAHAARKYTQVHETSVRYVWAREWDKGEVRPHYHVAVLVNRDAYHTLGRTNSLHDTMRSRIEAAWANSLGLHPFEVKGLVHFCNGGVFGLMQDQLQGVDEFFFALSYLCKEATKRFDLREHSFGHSQC